MFVEKKEIHTLTFTGYSVFDVYLSNPVLKQFNKVFNAIANSYGKNYILRKI